VIDASALRVVLAILMAWLIRQEDGVLRYLMLAFFTLSTAVL
jgi:hypothetical protein